MRVILAAALLLLPSTALAADQFDLSCMTAKPNKKSTPFIIKVDLAAGEWCIGKCAAVFKVKSVTSSMIVLGETDDRDGRAGQWVDRLTGEYYFYEESPKAGLFGRWTQRGKCTAQPFTGFGTERAKF